MSKHKYSTDMEGARVVGRDLPISTKHAVEICNFIRGKELQYAKKVLEEVVALKRAIPYTRFNWNLGHKRGMAGGRYPIKTAKYIIQLLNSVETNAQFKGMNTSRLNIVHMVPHKASRPMHGGTYRGRTMKRSHVEIIVTESAGEDVKKKKQKKEKKTSSDQK